MSLLVGYTDGVCRRLARQGRYILSCCRRAAWSWRLCRGRVQNWTASWGGSTVGTGYSSVLEPVTRISFWQPSERSLIIGLNICVPAKRTKQGRAPSPHPHHLNYTLRSPGCFPFQRGSAPSLQVLRHKLRIPICFQPRSTRLTIGGVNVKQCHVLVEPGELQGLMALGFG